jgi:hypothetical protein
MGLLDLAFDTSLIQAVFPRIGMIRCVIINEMRLLSLLLLQLFVLISVAFANVSLSEKFKSAEEGDYVAIQSGKMIHLIILRSITDHSWVFEEISVPESKKIASWPEWIRKRALGHTSWSMLEIDRKTSQVLECYSFTKEAHIQISQKESLIANLLHLPLSKIPREKQRKIGPEPMEGESDFRKIWTPPLIFEGKKISSPRFDVFKTHWPIDESELSGRDILLYFDQTSHTQFPYWIQVETSHFTGNFRVIDSGKHLKSPQRPLPKRAPRFVKIEKTPDQMVFTINTPSYFHQFSLFLVEIKGNEKILYPIESQLLKREGPLMTFTVDIEEMNVLEERKRYSWLVVPDTPDISLNCMSKPFIWAEN